MSTTDEDDICTEGSNDTNQFLVVSTAEHNVTWCHLRTLFEVQNRTLIRLNNRYYSASVHVSVMTDVEVSSKIRDLQWRKRLEYVPAVLLMCDGSNESIIQCKRVWGDISTLLDECTIRLLYITDGQLNECETYKLLQWSVQSNIEMVSQVLCEDDGCDASKRLSQALECARWKCRLTNEQSEGERVEGKESSEEDLRANVVKLSCSTRLRRSFDDNDLTNILDVLLLDDSSEEL